MEVVGDTHTPMFGYCSVSQRIWWGQRWRLRWPPVDIRHKNTMEFSTHKQVVDPNNPGQYPNWLSA